jgi:hypothetical protein
VLKKNLRIVPYLKKLRNLEIKKELSEKIFSESSFFAID